jgi:uncharacterized protein
MTSATTTAVLPFDPDELQDLRDALAPRTIDEAAGFLAAISSVPNAIAVGTWLTELLPEALRNEEASFDRVLALVARFQQHINAALGRDDSESFTPEGENKKGVRDFCAGYMDVVDQIEVDSENESVLADLFALELLAGRVSDEELREVIEPGAAIEAYVERAREDLPDIVAALYEAWEPLRRRGSTNRRESPKVGRNDPCPCGSGKKHKKCCGAALN